MIYHVLAVPNGYQRIKCLFVINRGKQQATDIDMTIFVNAPYHFGQVPPDEQVDD